VYPLSCFVGMVLLFRFSKKEEKRGGGGKRGFHTIYPGPYPPCSGVKGGRGGGEKMVAKAKGQRSAVPLLFGGKGGKKEKRGEGREKREAWTLAPFVRGRSSSFLGKGGEKKRKKGGRGIRANGVRVPPLCGKEKKKRGETSGGRPGEPFLQGGEGKDTASAPLLRKREQWPATPSPPPPPPQEGKKKKKKEKRGGGGGKRSGLVTTLSFTRKKKKGKGKGGMLRIVGCAPEGGEGKGKNRLNCPSMPFPTGEKKRKKEG